MGLDAITKSSIVSVPLKQAGIFKRVFNSWLPYEPIVLVCSTALATHILHELYQRVPNDGVYEGVKRYFFKTVKKIPIVRQKIDEEMSKTAKSIEDGMIKLFTDENGECNYIINLPDNGMDQDSILKLAEKYVKLGNYKWEDNVVSGTVYHGGQPLTELNTKVYSICAWANPLHPDVFPGICKMEAEIVRIATELFHGDIDEVVGTVTSGGTESIMLAVKAYRDWGMAERGIRYPEIVVARTAHAAFDKACQFLNMKIKHVPVDPKTCKVDVKAMRRMISKNTVMLVASAPAFPHGCIDDVEQVAALGKKYSIPVHVDSCLGGFVLAFMPQAGYQVPPFDFRVNGVTSISADTHKYGYAPKGTSLLLFRGKKFKRYQYFVEPNWPGAIYASPTMAGSRSGATIAGCWSTLLFFGVDGYTKATKKIIDASRYIKENVNKINGVYVMGDPMCSVIAIASDDFDIYRLVDDLSEKGWNVSNLQFPPSIHITITHRHTEPGIKEKFIYDIQKSAEEIMKYPQKPSEGAAVVYGLAQKIPDRSLVSDIAALYLDNLYRTEMPSDLPKKSNGSLK